MKNSRFSRRWFLKTGSVAVAGVWSGCSNQMPARALRGFLAESCRSIQKPRFIPDPSSWDRQTITAAWLGHATVLIGFCGVNILTDPALFRRIGADTCFGTVGPKRLVAPPLDIHELPRIDLVLLSHAHMDHMDMATLRALPGGPKGVSAHATEDLLADTCLVETATLRWGDKARIVTESGDLQVTAFEVKHWGARWRHDIHRGYNGYIVEREGRKIIFGGDTAWSESFRSMRRKGPYDLAIMPIGAYEPWIGSHCTPEQAVRMTNEAGAAYLLPIHFKTFAFGREGSVEPLVRLEASLDSERIGWREVGGTFVCPAV